MRTEPRGVTCGVTGPVSRPVSRPVTGPVSRPVTGVVSRAVTGAVSRARTRACLVITAALLVSSPVAGQTPLLGLDQETTVSGVGFWFMDHQTFSRIYLKTLITYVDPGGLAGLRRLVSVLPFVPDPVPQTFQPIELQRDLVRLRQFYRSSGFPYADFDYTVDLDEEKNTVRITHFIREGDPRTRGSLAVSFPDGQTAPDFLPEELRPEWEYFLANVPPRVGERIGQLEVAQLEESVGGWLKNRGWPFATVRVEVEADSVQSTADVLLVTDPGPRARIDEVRVNGNRQVSGWVSRRAMPLKPGDLFSSELMTRGQQNLFGLDLVRFARSEVLPGQPIDSTVTLVSHIEEALPRIVSGEAGFATETGVSTEASWAHRDFIGGARTLTISATAQTGWLGFARERQSVYGLSVALKQPLLFGSTTTGIARPFIDYRNDLSDRSWQTGADLTVVYQARSDQSISIGYGLSKRRVLEYRGAGSTDLDFLSRLAIADSLGTDIKTSALTVTWLSERLDDTRDPRLGRVLRATGQVAGPAAVSTVSYGRVDLSAAAFKPFGESSTLAGRIGVGRLFPLGQSVPDPGDDPTRSILRLRDALFTAGGSYGVRGWGEQLLGPKTPDAQGDLDEPLSLTASRYVPIGGLARMQSTVEVRLPMPIIGSPHGVHAFFDAGRVWNPDQRFPTGGPDETRMFFSTGGGVEFASAVGPIRLTVGYKLNPSVLDVRDAGDVLQALINDESVLDVSTLPLRRFHLHLTLGRTF